MDQEEIERHRKYDARNNLRVPIKFEANDVEQAAFDAFSAEHLPTCGPPKDAMHTRWQFTFTLGGVGTVTVARCIICGMEKNITDYDSW